MRTYSVRAASLLGFSRKHFSTQLGGSFHGIVAEDCDTISVALPSTCVSEFGAWWFGRVHNPANYAVYAEYVRRWCQRVDWATPEQQEDCLIYGSYLGFVHRKVERENQSCLAAGRVYSQRSLTLLAGAAVFGITSLQTAAAATAVSTSVLAGPAALFVASTVLPSVALIGIAALTAAALHRMFHGFATERVVADAITSVTSKAPTPPQHEDTDIQRRDPPRAHDFTRVAAYPTGTTIIGHEPVVFASNQDNTVAALEKRSGCEPAPGDRAAFIAWVSKWWPVLVAPERDLRVPTDEAEQDQYVEDWVKGCNSSSAMKTRLRKAWAAMRQAGHNLHDPVSGDLAADWTSREVSVKIETLNKDESGHPRQIMAAQPEFTCVVAPFIKALTGLVRHRMNKGKFIFTPGMWSSHVAELMTDREWPNRANYDFNSYDSNQGTDTANHELEIARRHGATTLYRQLQRAKRRVHGRGRQGVKFQARCTRLSGDPETTLFNTLWNLFAVTYVICHHRGVTPYDVDMRVFGSGDDGHVCYSGPRVPLAEGLAALGLPATVKHVNHCNEVEFVSCRLTRTSKGWQLIPKLGRLLVKMSHSVRATPENGAAILAGAAESLAKPLSGSPIGQALLAHWQRITAGVRPITPRDEPWKMQWDHTGHPVTETWDDLGSQYGWGFELHAAFERALDDIKTCGEATSAPALLHLVEADSARKDSLSWQPPEADEPAARGAPLRDLCEQGVEPNPGPNAPNDFHTSAALCSIGEQIAVVRARCLLDTVERPPLGTCPWGRDHIRTCPHCEADTAPFMGNSPTIAQAVEAARWAHIGGNPTTSTAIADTAVCFFFAARDHAATHRLTTVFDSVHSTARHPEGIINPRDRAPGAIAGPMVFVKIPGTPSVVVEARTPRDAITCVLPRAPIDNFDFVVGGKIVGSNHPLAQEDNLEIRPKLRGGSGYGRATRAENILKAVQEKTGMTDEGKNWLLCALDPFHDSAIAVCGYPDTTNDASIVQVYRQSIQISAPTGISSGTWDLRMISLPWKTAPLQMGQGIQLAANGGGANPGNVFWTGTTETSSTANVGGVWWVASPAGTSANSYTFADGATNNVAGCLAVPNTILSGVNRVIGSGFECTNTTAPIYKQGTVTVSRCPLPEYTSGVPFTWATGAGGANSCSVGTVPILGIPVTTAQELLLSGSRQWAAEFGVYAVSAFNSTDIPKQGVVQLYPCVAAAPFTGVASVQASMPGVSSVTTGTGTNLAAYPYLWAKQDAALVHFTGLSLQSTINLTVVDYVEQFPDPVSSPALVTLARTSPRYDPIAIELYSFLLRNMPVAVPVGENGFGDWIASAISKVSDFVAPVLSMIPHPIAKGAGIALSAAGSVAKAFTPREENAAVERASEARARAPGPAVMTRAPPRAPRVSEPVRRAYAPAPRAPVLYQQPRQRTAPRGFASSMNARQLAALDRLRSRSQARRY